MKHRSPQSQTGDSVLPPPRLNDIQFKVIDPFFLLQFWTQRFFTIYVQKRFFGEMTWGENWEFFLFFWHFNHYYTENFSSRHAIERDFSCNPSIRSKFKPFFTIFSAKPRKIVKNHRLSSSSIKSTFFELKTANKVFASGQAIREASLTVLRPTVHGSKTSRTQKRSLCGFAASGGVLNPQGNKRHNGTFTGKL